MSYIAITSLVPLLGALRFSSMDPQKYIGSNLRIKTADGRLLDGILTVIDPFGNLLLSNVKEMSQDRLNVNNVKERELGLVSVPREEIVVVMQDKKQVVQ